MVEFPRPPQSPGGFAWWSLLPPGGLPTQAAGGAGVSSVEVESLNLLFSGGNSLIHRLLVPGGIAVLFITTAGLKSRHKQLRSPIKVQKRLIGWRRGRDHLKHL